ncbi:Mpv17 [Thalictrum thalictroides]|uniref:Mpv17 n=1 Tax=Thalictrum thalictroides TaxID=46969 RepID=A0A7J6XFG6_THATH|nr:Mpv17 [Thalictrum thalictroides]
MGVMKFQGVLDKETGEKFVQIVLERPLERLASHSTLILQRIVELALQLIRVSVNLVVPMNALLFLEKAFTCRRIIAAFDSQNELESILFVLINLTVKTMDKFAELICGNALKALKGYLKGGSMHSLPALANFLNLDGKLKDFTFSPPSLYSSTSSTSTSFSYSSTFIGNGFVKWYLTMIKKHPIGTKSITSAGIYTAADISSQMLIDTSSESYDFLRTLRMAGYGMLLAGPTMHFWFNSMSKVLPQRDIITTLKKIFVGQIVYGPIMTAVFFSLNAGLQGENGAEIVARLKRDLLPTLRNGLLYWPLCDFVTFKFIPVHLQPLMTNSFAYLWTIYITYMANLNKVNPAIVEVD